MHHDGVTGPASRPSTVRRVPAGSSAVDWVVRGRATWRRDEVEAAVQIPQHLVAARGSRSSQPTLGGGGSS